MRCDAIETMGARMSAVVAGGERFGMRIGRSGRRYVFSRVDHPVADGDFDGAVIVVVRRGAGAGAPASWVGEADDAGAVMVTADHEIHAHWLAETAVERRWAILDLGGTIGPAHGPASRQS
jgi:hypothetical protein